MKDEEALQMLKDLFFCTIVQDYFNPDDFIKKIKDTECSKEEIIKYIMRVSETKVIINNVVDEVLKK